MARFSRRLLVRIAQLHLRTATSERSIGSGTRRVTMTLIALVFVAGIVLIPSIRSVADEFEAFATLLTALGATYGTIIALVLTLSIIPVERAGEAWSVFIVRLYRRDLGTYMTFVWLGVCCVASFVLAVDDFGNFRVSFLLAASFLVLGISLDVLRWYHSHVCKLLDPEHAVDVGLKKARRTVDRLNRVVARNARILDWRPFAKEEPRLSSGLVKPDLYMRMPGYPDALVAPIDDLAEMARKAIARGERPLARAAIGSIAELTNYYLSSRRDNLMVYPHNDPERFGGGSDVDVVTDETYGRLREISRAAVNASDEATAIKVSRAFRGMAVHAARLGAPAFETDTAPLSKAPLYHAFDCVKFAQSKGLDEVGLRSAWILGEATLDVPQLIAKTDVCIPIVNGLHDIATAFYAAFRFRYAETVTRYQLVIAGSARFSEASHFLKVLEAVLEKIELQVPLAIENEKAAGGSSGRMPLGSAYSPTDVASLGWEFARSVAGLYAAEDEAGYQAEYRLLLQVQEAYSNHLRSVARSNEFGGSALVREIDRMIKQIGVTIVGLVDRPPPFDQGNQDDLVSGFTGFFGFYAGAFREKRSIDGRRVEECSDSLVYLGLRFASIGHPNVLRHCLWCIQSIIRSICESIEPANFSALGGVLALLWGVRETNVGSNEPEIAYELDRALDKPADVRDDVWQQAQPSIRLRREEFQKRLAEASELPNGDNAEALLRELMGQVAAGN